MIPGHVLFKYVNTQIVVAVCMLATGASVILMPLMKQLVSLHMVNVIFGLTLSYIEIGKLRNALPSFPSTERRT